MVEKNIFRLTYRIYTKVFIKITEFCYKHVYKQTRIYLNVRLIPIANLYSSTAILEKKADKWWTDDNKVILYGLRFLVLRYESPKTSNVFGLISFIHLVKLEQEIF